MKKSNLFMIVKENLNIFLILASSIFLIFLSFYNSFFCLIALLINVIAIFLLPIDKCSILLVSLLPFAYVYKIDSFSTSLFVVLFLLSTLIMMCKKPKIENDYYIYLVVFSLLIILQFKLASTSLVFSFIKLIVGLVLLYLLCKSYKKNNFDSIIVFFIISVLISSFIALTMKDRSVLNNRISMNENLIDFTYSRFRGLQNDPNYYNSSLIISLLGIFYLFIKKRVKISFFIISAFLVYFGLLTYSKSFFLLLVLWLLMIIYYSLREKKYLVGLIFLTLSIFFCIYVFSGKVQVVDVIVSRFYDEDGGITTGRTEIWQLFFNYFKSNILGLLFGNGLESLTLQTHAAHNSYIDLLYYFGLIGTILFFILIFKCFDLKNFRLDKKHTFGIIFSIFVLILYFFLSGIVTCELPFMLYFCYIFLKESEKEVAQK